MSHAEEYLFDEFEYEYDDDVDEVVTDYEPYVSYEDDMIAIEEQDFARDFGIDLENDEEYDDDESF